MAGEFYPILGWGVFWVAFVLAIVLFATYRRLYPVMYMVSVALYIFTTGFMIDVFDFEKGGILLTLVFSALLFMGLGYYLSKVLHLQKPTE
jgi:hypothetical protein